MHEDVVLSYKGRCHKMARIARCGVAFPYAWVANGIFGESPGKENLLQICRAGG